MIGFFDSGFGGLFVLREVVRHLPGYDYIYLGDSARAPYGSRSPEEIDEYTKQGVELLFAHGAELIILACNTASSESLRQMQALYVNDPRKILGVLVPFAEEAAARTRNKRVGVMATEATVRSNAYPREIQKIDHSIQVFQQACPGLVPLIEAGEQDSARIEMCLREYSTSLIGQDIDTLVLGCTHYGVLAEKIGKLFGPSISIVQERDVVPGKLEAYLARHPEIDSRLSKHGSVSFFCTGSTDSFSALGGIFFGLPIRAEQAVLGV